MRVVVAIPTIAVRPGLAERTAQRWIELTPGATVDPVISTAGSSWGDGLNDVWERTRDEAFDLLVCASDDMAPESAAWLPALLPWLDRGYFCVPRVSDPRFENYGGPKHPSIPVPDGTPTFMATFPILKREWLKLIFPLPDGQHYYCDNLISTILWRAGIKAVAVPSCRILHLHAKAGRGAGYDSENTRLHVDTVRYTRALDARGIERLALPKPLRGDMWEDSFHAVGLSLGA